MTSDTQTYIQDLITGYLNGDANLTNLHGLLTNIQDYVANNEADVGQAFAAYTRENNGLVIFIITYNPAGVLTDIQKVSAGVFKWNDSFEPPQVGVTWFESDQDPRINTATYGSGPNSSSITPLPILDTAHADWVWTCVTPGINLGKAPTEVVVNSALAFELKNPSA